MRATNIKWDVADGAEEMTEEEIADAFASLPTEVELPEKFNRENYTDEDGYHEDELIENAAVEFIYVLSVILMAERTVFLCT